MAKEIPSVLQPYISLPPPSSLTLVTDVVGASCNWVLIRFLQALLDTSGDPEYQAISDTDRTRDQPPIVFASWLQPASFWQTEAKRTLGLDLNEFSQQKRYAFLDGLASPMALRHESHVSDMHPSPFGSSLQQVESSIRAAILSLNKSEHAGESAPKPVLILDSPGILLHAFTPLVTAAALSIMLQRLLPQVHSIIVSLAADDPLLAASKPGVREPDFPMTPLDYDYASLVVSLSHEARLVMSLRRLDTGWAHEVSGVMRATSGGALADETMDAADSAEFEVPEGEWLYFVDGHGRVSAWARGSGERGAL